MLIDARHGSARYFEFPEEVLQFCSDLFRDVRAVRFRCQALTKCCLVETCNAEICNETNHTLSFRYTRRGHGDRGRSKHD